MLFAASSIAARKSWRLFRSSYVVGANGKAQSARAVRVVVPVPVSAAVKRRASAKAVKCDKTLPALRDCRALAIANGSQKAGLGREPAKEGHLLPRNHVAEAVRAGDGQRYLARVGC